MPVQNSEIAEIFSQVADLLEIGDANPFRVRAYQNAARTVQGLGRDLTEMVAGGEDLSGLPGIGKDLAAKITEIVQNGKLRMLSDLETRLPAGLLELLKIPALGPKRVKALYQRLQVKDLNGLWRAARAGRIRGLEGFGPKLEELILTGLEHRPRGTGRRLWAEAEPVVQALLKHLRAAGIREVEAAGSFRRCAETVGDLDILAAAEKPDPVMRRFLAYEDVAATASRGPTRATVRLKNGLQVDLRVVAPASYGAALHYFTGSKAHNIAVRKLGQRRKLKINEYGAFRGSRRVAGRREEEIYRLVGLAYIPPELREMRGELEAAREGRLPKLVSARDLRGDLHAHTNASDGADSLEAMVQAARARGHEYLAITDHSQRVTVAHGLKPRQLAEQLKRIDRLNARLRGFTVLKGGEVDILADGSLDLPDALLDELDVVVASVHYQFRLSAEQQTSRILKALDNRRLNILAHPTGRLLGEREPYALDLERILREAKARGCHLELNSHPQRLDLDDVHCRLAKSLGVKIAINTDAHSVRGLDDLRYGVGQARRGWLEAGDVLNTRPLPELRKLLRRA